MAVADAVRISMSIPLVFTSRELDGDTYVDGGLLWNYPITIFDQSGTTNWETLGFHIHTKGGASRHSINNVHEYFANLFLTILNSQSDDLDNDPVGRRRSVYTDDLGINFASFDISREQKLALIEQGAGDTKTFLRNYTPPS